MARVLGSELRGLTYLIDEPSLGLHPDDTESLGQILTSLARRGENVLCVENNLALARHAEVVCALGPGAGKEGGRVLSMQPGAALPSVQSIEEVPASRGSNGTLHLRSVRAHNLREVSLALPLGCIVAVCGASGSGKSTLLFDVVVPLLQVLRRRPKPGELKRALEMSSTTGASLDGIVSRVISARRLVAATVDGTVASSLGVLEPLAQLYAAIPAAQAAGVTARDFARRSARSRCDRCVGATADRCPQCRGTRYAAFLSQYRYRGRSIAEMGALEIRELAELLLRIPPIASPLTAAMRLGLGYLRLSQGLRTLSLGELHRVRLARVLVSGLRTNGVAILDEPGAGLPGGEQALVMREMRSFTERGNSIVFIEHSATMIARADHVIELGPGGGSLGGSVIATGTPQEIARNPNSRIARHLQVSECG
ncbi:MAG: hypothetical protein IT290_12180 [Deltaproteobacteria bacterium]|nr:hypothetical protein [Deltaproteobacteria bacterium]